MNLLSVLYAGKKQPKQIGKMPEIRKNSTENWWRQFFEKFWQNPQILKSRSRISSLESQSQSRNFRWSRGIQVTSLHRWNKHGINSVCIRCKDWPCAVLRGIYFLLKFLRLIPCLFHLWSEVTWSCSRQNQL